MTVEAATYISDLNASYPAVGDDVSEGDNHVKLIKSTVKATFPNISGAVTPTHTELNYVDGVTSAIQTQLDAKAATTQPSATAATLVNSWANQGGAYQACEFWKDTLGYVHIHGSIKSGATGTVAFTLDAGSRPAATQVFRLPDTGALSQYANASIASTGDVTINFNGVSIFSLDGIIFKAA